MKLFKSFTWSLAILHLLVAAQELVNQADGESCAFTLSVSGLNKPIGQASDGRLSVGDAEEEAVFRVDSGTGALVDANGAGCTVLGQSLLSVPQVHRV